MPKILFIDCETTGLNLIQDRILTFGMALWDGKILFEKITYLHHDSYPQNSPEALAINGITRKMSEAFGEDPTDFYRELAIFIDKHEVKYLCAHNAHGFDIPMLINNADEFCASLRNFFKNMKVIDTRLDLPIPGTKLQYMAAEHGFLNPFPHSALSDVRTMVKIFENYNVDEIIKRAESPLITISAKTTYAEKEKPKRAKFYWDTATQKWLKQIKLCDLDELKKTCDFEIEEIKA